MDEQPGVDELTRLDQQLGVDKQLGVDELTRLDQQPGVDEPVARRRLTPSKTDNTIVIVPNFPVAEDLMRIIVWTE